MPAALQDTITISLGVLFEALPFVFLGITLSVFVQTYVRQGSLIKVLPKNKFLRRSILSISGSALPVCECGNVPLSRGLMAKGLQSQDVIVFLLAAPIINPITITTTIQAFPGGYMTPLRIVGALFVANAVGWVLSSHKSTELVTKEFRSYCEDSSHHTVRRSLSLLEHVQNFSHRFAEESTILMPALLGGSLVAGVIQTVIPRTILTSFANEPVVAILSMIILAFIVSICANVDAFFALSLSGIFPQSALLAFLVFGPMIDIKMLALMRTTFTTRTLVIVSTLVFLFTFLFSLGAHYVI
ncbi:permease [Candidatus Saccharibacteria bacterium]|nr:permease [Candidatus Saccharibacteria bacterium]